MPEFGFGKSLRLLDSAAFSRVFSQAEIKVACPAMLILAARNGCCHPRLGLVIPKRQVKFATGRNAVKRAIRESFRLRQHSLPAVDIVVLARGQIGGLSQTELKLLLDKQWERLERKSAPGPGIKP